MCHGLLRRERHGAFSLPPAYMMYRSYSLPDARVQTQRLRPTWRIKALAQVCIVPIEVECFGPIAQWNEWRFPVSCPTQKAGWRRSRVRPPVGSRLIIIFFFFAYTSVPRGAYRINDGRMTLQAAKANWGLVHDSPSSTIKCWRAPPSGASSFCGAMAFPCSGSPCSNMPAWASRYAGHTIWSK